MMPSPIVKKVIWKSIIPILLGNIGIKTPLEIIHQINFACNLNCKYCGFPQVKVRELSTNQIKQAIEEFSQAGTISWNFTGGEPLLRKDLGELADFVKECGINRVMLNTNGLLYKYRKRELKSLDEIFISLDGPKEVHEFMRGKRTFEKVIEAIDMVKKDGFYISLTSVLSHGNMKNNFDGLKFLFDFARKKDIPINFNIIYTHDFNKDFIEQYKTEINQTIKALKLIIEFDKQTGLCERSVTLYKETIEQLEGKKTKIKSFAGILYCRIMPNGLVAPCTFNLNEGIDGTKYGFLNAFKMISKTHNCNFLYSYHTAKDLEFSFDLNAIAKFFEKYHFLGLPK